MEYKVETVPVYRVKGDRKTFRSYEAIVGRMAWLVVFDKYSETYDVFTGDNRITMKNTPPKRYECDCHHHKYELMSTGDGETMPGFYDCPIHDRRTGYLRRLHDRYVRLYILSYPMPRLAEFPNDVSEL